MQQYCGTHHVLADELTADLELGVRYDVPGLQTNAYFHAWNVQRWVSDIKAKVHHQEFPSLHMPPAIRALYTDLRYVMQTTYLFLLSPFIYPLITSIGRDMTNSGL
jgi:hypothetical protein